MGAAIPLAMGVALAVKEEVGGTLQVRTGSETVTDEITPDCEVSLRLGLRVWDCGFEVGSQRVRGLSEAGRTKRKWIGYGPARRECDAPPQPMTAEDSTSQKEN